MEALAYIAFGVFLGAAGTVALAHLIVVRRRRGFAGIAGADVPLPSDPRWQPTVESSDRMVMLVAGDVEVRDGDDTFALLVKGVPIGDTPGAQQYVERVHAAWRARRQGTN